MENLDIKYYLSVFWRRFPYFLLVAAFVSAIGLTVAAVLPPVYRSTAVILVEAPQIPGGLAQSTVPINAVEQIQSIQQRLLTRANLLDIANRFDIYADRPDMNANDVVQDMRDRVTFDTRRPSRGGRRLEGATFIRVSFDSEKPAIAADVANDITTQLLQENVRIRQGRATDTLEFFEQEVARLSGEIDNKSEEILAFRLAHQNALPDSLQSRRNQQTLNQERLIQLQRDEANARETRDRIIAVYEQTGQVFSNRKKTSEEQELESLKRELNRVSAVYTDTNPRVGILKTRIAALEPIVAEQLTMVNPEFIGMSELDIQLTQLDTQLEQIEKEQARIEVRLAELETSIRETPANEIVLAGIVRDQANLKEQYDSAVGRMSRAAVGERLEVLAKGERFSIVEQPVTPQTPVRPNRLLLSGGSIAAGLGVGLAFIVLLELLNQSIRRPVEISNKLGLEPLATIPYIRTAREANWKRVIIATLLVLIILAVPTVLFALHTYYLPLDLLVQTLLSKIGLGGLFV